MKRLFSFPFPLVFLLALLPHSPAVGQILNAGFEDWAGGNPVSWFTSNYPEQDPSSVNITRDTLAHEGAYAVRGELVTAISVIPEIPGPFDHYPQVSSTGGNDPIIRGFPISSRPKQLRGWWMYRPAGEYGLLGADVLLYKGETAVALGGASRVAISSDSEYVQFTVPINYLTDDVPDAISISIGITAGEVGDVFYVDDLSLDFFREIIAPEEGEVVIANEVDTIRWDPFTGDVDIGYSLDDGATYTSIATDYPGSPGRYVWDVPDYLPSTKARIRVSDSNIPAEQAVSGRFYLKTWWLTRVNGSGDFELFNPDEHGWSAEPDSANWWPQSWWQQFDYIRGTDPRTGNAYPNFIPQFADARSDDFPDWPLFVSVFGDEQCYLGSASPPTEYSTRALDLWRAVVANPYVGSCYGHAVSSLLAFFRKTELLSRFPGIGSFSELYGVPLTDDARLAVNHYFTHQTGQESHTLRKQRRSTVDARQTLHELKEMLGANNTDARPISFDNNNGSGGHAVVPYRLLRKENPTQFTLWVYDSNKPGDLDASILIDSAANTWTEQMGLGWGTGTTGLFLVLPASMNLLTPTLSAAPVPHPGAAVRTMSAVSGLEIYNTSGASIAIHGLSGDSIGYADSAVFNTLADAVPVIPLTGSFHPPIGYTLPDVGYSVEMGNVPDTSAHLMFFTDSLVYAYRRSGIVPSETDLLFWDGGVGMKNPDAAPKSVGLEVVISGDGTERIFTLSGLGISSGDSVHVTEEGGAELVAGNFGGGTTYDLEVRSASGTGTRRFFHTGVPIVAGVGHRIVPDWGDVEGGAMKILIDAGNDGSVDDSMFVSNELTSVEDRVASAVPSEYRLLQNYPNPFNPVTTIAFDLPEVSEVRLKVYTLAGEEVAVLADGVRQPGTYRARFDGSGLPSGVYVYRMTAGTFSAAGKMVLMK